MEQGVAVAAIDANLCANGRRPQHPGVTGSGVKNGWLHGSAGRQLGKTDRGPRQTAMTCNSLISASAA